MFWKQKAHIHDVLKWGILSGLFESAFIFLTAILYWKRAQIMSEGAASFVLILLVAISAIITTIIVFAHPMHLVHEEHYLDAIYTIITTLVTIALASGFIYFAFAQTIF